MSDYSTDLDVCLCCGGRYRRVIEGRIDSDRAERALRLFERRGLTIAELLGKHREQLDYQAPGFVDWLERR